MRYQVEFVSDDSLPAGVEWVFARTLGETYLFVKRSAIDHARDGHGDDVLCRAWTAWQATHSPVGVA
jgi:hypothetical protein